MLLTTAISYTNGDPHIGHAFEFILTDVVARWYRTVGKNVWFLTGTDEHGQKVENTAKRLGTTPKELCDLYSGKFRQLCDTLQISYDEFIRTTESRHHATVVTFFEKCLKNDDIYLGVYQGWYNMREETFVSEFEAQKTEYIDPVSNTTYERMHEQSYFFRLSKYQDRIKEFILAHPDFILPISHRNSILQRLDEPLNDLSISRKNVKWGIPVPNDDDGHTLYVWFDALINYISGANGQWPPAIQVIGKDITWFHTVIWLGMLMSANIELPKHIFVHGFVCDSSGKKMSKSLGNIVSPQNLVEKYPVDAIRFYLTKEFSGSDFHFSSKDLEATSDFNLLSNLGNFVNRTLGLLYKYSNSRIPKVKAELYFDVASTTKILHQHIENFQLHLYVDHVFSLLHKLNSYINDAHIWTIQNPKHTNDTRTDADRQIVIRTLLESVYIMAHLIEPVIPNTAFQISQFLDTPLGKLSDLEEWSSLQGDKVITKQPTILFRILDEKSAEKRKKKHSQKRK